MYCNVLYVCMWMFSIQSGNMFAPILPATIWHVTNLDPRFRCQWLTLYGAWPISAQRWPSSELWRSEHGLFDDGWPVGQRHLNAPSATEHWLEAQWNTTVIHDDYKEQWMNWWLMTKWWCRTMKPIVCWMMLNLGAIFDILPRVVHNRLTLWWIC